jgi:hypothetical protein
MQFALPVLPDIPASSPTLGAVTLAPLTAMTLALLDDDLAAHTDARAFAISALSHLIETPRVSRDALEILDPTELRDIARTWATSPHTIERDLDATTFPESFRDAVNVFVEEDKTVRASHWRSICSTLSEAMQRTNALRDLSWGNAIESHAALARAAFMRPPIPEWSAAFEFKREITALEHFGATMHASLARSMAVPDFTMHASLARSMVVPDFAMHASLARSMVVPDFTSSFVQMTSAALDAVSRSAAATADGGLVAFVRQQASLIPVRNEPPEFIMQPTRTIRTGKIARHWIEADDDVADELRLLGAEYAEALRGAAYTLTREGPDCVRHVAVSLRELVTHMLHRLAPDEAVRRWSRNPSDYHNDKPTRAARLRYIFRASGATKESAAIVERDIQQTLDLMRLLQGGTHGLATTMSLREVRLLYRRVRGILPVILEASRWSDSV